MLEAAAATGRQPIGTKIFPEKAEGAVRRVCGPLGAGRVPCVSPAFLRPSRAIRALPQAPVAPAGIGGGRL